VKKVWMILGAVVVVGSGVLWMRSQGRNGTHEQAFRLAPISRGSIKATVSSSGTLNPLNTVKVGSQVSGIIKELYADYNTLVRRDEVVALIDPAFYEAQVEQAKAQLLMAKAQDLENQRNILAAEAAIDSAKAQLSAAAATQREAELNYQRYQRLDKKEAISKSNLDAALAKRDNAQGALEMAEAQLRTANANLNKSLAQQEGSKALIAQREAALHLAEIQLCYCTIKSPIDGIVISRQVDVGQTVAASLQSPVLFTIAEDLSRMQVEADVSEADVGQIQPDQDVEFTVDAFPDKKFKAKVRQVRNAANNIQNVVTYTIVADVQNDSLLLRPGMTANVTIIVADVSDALKVPNAALRFKPPNESQTDSTKRSVPIRERPTFKNAVDKIGLDAAQADQFESFIKDAAVKLKAAYALPEEQRDITQAWKNFYVEINRKLYGVLRGDQYEKFKAYIEELKATLEKRKSNKKLKSAKVYLLNDEGIPEARNVMAGVTDETQTQILTEELKEGDNVIVGIAFDAGGAKKERSSILSAILGGRNR
jgi:HlyD family secretion protein